jgi:hypothetical protein
MSKKVTLMDIEQIAMHMLKVKHQGNVEDAVIDTYGIDLETYGEIIRPILEKLTIAISPISKEALIGISDPGFWIYKHHAKQQFIDAMIQWLTECEDMPPTGQGFVRGILVDGKVKYQIGICNGDTKLTVKKKEESKS